jgi:N-methylhydantoinase A
LHKQIFAIEDPESAVAFLCWNAKVACRLRETTAVRLAVDSDQFSSGSRMAYFPDHGALETPVFDFATAGASGKIEGPAIVESPFTTIVVPPGASLEQGTHGNILVYPGD